MDTSYEELSEKYGLKAAEVAPLPVENLCKSDEPTLKISTQELYTKEDLIEGGWDLSACYGLASSSYDAGNKDNLISVSFVNDTNTDVYDAYVDLRGNISFLKSRSAGAAYKYNTYLDTNWLWFSDKGKCLGWATAMKSGLMLLRWYLLWFERNSFYSKKNRTASWVYSRIQSKTSSTEVGWRAPFELAAEEIATNNIRPGLWAKAMAEADGDDAKAKVDT